MSLDEVTGRTKIEVARDAVSLFLQLVRSGSGNRLGLVSFSTTASSPADFNITSVTDNSKNTLIGPPPFSGGTVGGLAPGGATSIGEGLDAARLQFPTPGANPRSILLLTDGLQNTPRMVNEVEGSLAGIAVHAIGFGTEASLDGSLLTGLATRHDGLYMRAGNGLALQKFFSHAFGNIFEAGVILDPEFDLPANQRTGSPLTFHVCGEETITVVAGWDRIDASLFVEVKTPNSVTISASSPGVESSSGQSWTFFRFAGSMKVWTLFISTRTASMEKSDGGWKPRMPDKHGINTDEADRESYESAREYTAHRIAEECSTELRKKHEDLKMVALKNLPNLWPGLEFALSVKSI